MKRLWCSDKKTMKKIRVGRKSHVGIVVDKSDKYWLLDTGDYNTIIAGSRNFGLRRVLWTMEYLSTMYHSRPTLLLFTVDDESEQILNHAHNIFGKIPVTIVSDDQCTSFQASPLEDLFSSSATLFVQEKYWDVVVSKLLDCSHNECQDSKFPIPVLVFLSAFSGLSANYLLLMAQAKGHNFRFILRRERSWSFSGFIPNEEAFESVLSENGGFGATICKRGSKPVACAP